MKLVIDVFLCGNKEDDQERLMAIEHTIEELYREPSRLQKVGEHGAVDDWGTVIGTWKITE